MGNNIYNQNSLLPIGTLLQMGKYRIDRYLSSGGFGNTYVITNLQFDEQFAMKEFFMKGINERDDDNTSISVSNKDNHTQFEQQREKFKKEARRLRKLSNKHIVRVHDLFDENGTTYYVMDLIDGQSVSSIMKQTGSPLSEEKALDIVRQVLEALDVVHKEKIWHLDLKPGNIMLDKQGNVVVIDFGASKQLSANEGYTSTSTALCYTPGYAPSEQIDQNMERIGPWTDLYALGATLYNMVTLNLPPSVSEIIDGNAFRFPKSISENTRELITWMMMPSRQKRPQTVEEVYEYLAKGGESNREESANEEKTDQDSEETIIIKKETKEGCKSKESNNNIDGKTDKSPDVETDRDIRHINYWVSASVIILLIVLFSLNSKPTSSPSNSGNKIASSLPQKYKLDIQNALLDSIKRINDKVSLLYEEVKSYSGEDAVIQKDTQSSLGDYLYTGPTDETGNPNGIGLAEFNDGRLYLGTFYHGKIQGDAYFRYENGDTFEGDFTNESKFGKGKYTIKEDGSYFVGSFRNGQPDKGQWYDRNGNKIN